MPDAMNPLMTVTDVAKYLKVPEQTVYRWNTKGTGPRPLRVGRHVRYLPEDVEAWVKNGNPPHRVI